MAGSKPLLNQAPLPSHRVRQQRRTQSSGSRNWPTMPIACDAVLSVTPGYNSCDLPGNSLPFSSRAARLKPCHRYLVMKTLFALFLVTDACAAQSSLSAFEDEHAKGLQQNPSGITFIISTIDGRSTYHLSDVIRFKLALTSKKPRVYTFETTSGLTTAAGAVDDLVIAGPDTVSPVHSRQRAPIAFVCCETKRRYLSQKPKFAAFALSFERLQGVKLKPDFTTASEVTPGEYAVFMQTRRVLRGWPKSENDTYSAVSRIVVTSSNILHLTILPNAPDPQKAKP